VLESLVITLREGVEAALVIAIVLAYLRKIGRMDLAPAVWTGLAAAFAGSIVGAILLRRWEVNEDVLEGWTMLAASVSIVTMAVWMSRTAHRLKGQIESRMGGYAERAGAAAAWGIGLFVFLMVGREGVETVLLFTAVSFTTAALGSLIGAALGLAGAITLGVLFVKGSLRVNLSRFFRVTTIILFVVAAQLLVTGLHELSESLVLPSSRREMALIGPLVTNDVAFFVLILALTVFLVAARSENTRAAPNETPPGPERRLALAAERREALWRRGVILAAGMTAVIIAGGYVYSRSANALTPAVPVMATGSDVRIPAADLADGKLHRYAIDVDGVTVRFLVIRAGADNVRTAFDACQICGADGYLQKGTNVVCRTCGSAINIPTIGMSGGCNPRHLDSRVSGDVYIPLAALQAGRVYFQ
jgi:FTR1 family protein